MNQLARKGVRILLCASLLAISACSQSPAPDGAASNSSNGSAVASTLPDGHYTISGRTVTFQLPYRGADGLLWVSATRAADAQPFAFQSLDVQPGAGPQGSDLAVFVYRADRPGTAVLKFGLVPAGKTLIGLPGHVYEGVPAKNFSATISVP